MEDYHLPSLHKAAKVIGKTLIFRNAKVSDAPFILTLRTDTEKSRHLSAVSGDLKEQEIWLDIYEKTEDQAYFIIEFQGAPIGTVRLYDPRGLSFCWGSWVLKNGSPSHAAIESALMVYAYAIDHLSFKSAHFDVRKGNVSVWQFHERFGAVRVRETFLDFFYELSEEAITKSRCRYRKFLEYSVIVEQL